MIERIYMLIWLVYVIAFALCYAIGVLTATVLVAFGFIGIGLILMGMIGLLPNWVIDHSDMKH